MSSSESSLRKLRVMLQKTHNILRIIARVIVSSHFIYELVDKISRFNYWKDIIAKQSSLGEWSLVLIIFLLFFGGTSLIFGRYLWSGLFCLALFQIPTSILFEDSLYESFDSLSALGGVFAICLLHHKPKRRSPSSSSEDRILHPRLLSEN